MVGRIEQFTRSPWSRFGAGTAAVVAVVAAIAGCSGSGANGGSPPSSPATVAASQPPAGTSPVVPQKAPGLGRVVAKYRTFAGPMAVLGGSLYVSNGLDAQER